MTVYKFVALKNNKELVESIIEAKNERDAREEIRALGFVPVKVFRDGEDVSSVLRPTKKPKIRLSLAQKRMFTTSLHSTVASGIPIIEALYIIQKESADDKVRTIALDIHKSIVEGSSFHQGLEKYKDSFGDLYLKLCKAGEMSGELDKVLARLIGLLRKQEEIKSKLIAASIYPSIILVAIVILLAFLGAKTFPAMMGTATHYGYDAPKETRMLIDMIQFFKEYWILIGIFAVGACYGVYNFFQSPKVKPYIDALLLKIPVVRDFVRCNEIANFVAVIEVAYESGIPMTECVIMAEETINNYYIKKDCDKIEGMLYRGVTFADACSRIDFIPADLQAVITVGEKSGRLGEMLAEASRVMDRKVFEIINNLSTLVGPALLLIVGVVVGFVMIAFYKFYYGMLGSLLG